MSDVRVLPQVVQIKAEICAEMQAQGVTRAELALRLRRWPMAVTRLLDPGYPSSLSTLEAALQVLGCRLGVRAVRKKVADADPS